MTRPTSIRRALSALATSALLAALFAVGLPATAAAAPICTPTGFIRDGIDLTAARINPSGTVTGDVDAAGCNIGIYYGPASRGKVSKATVHGANYFGIVNNGGKVDVKKSTIRDIGESPLNGSQHGIGISYVQDTLGSSGEISDNKVFNYQKGGIVVRGLGNKAQIEDNEVSGAGPVAFIAQNGIQVSDGAKANVHDNKVTGNSYTGAGLVSSGGILIFGGCGLNIVKDITIDKNQLVGNDVGIWLFNGDASCTVASPARTYITVKDNKVSNGAVNNTSGWGAPGQAYEAGIAVFGNKDKIEKNRVCGIGYTPVATPPPYLFFIDTTGAIGPQLKSNKTATGC